MEDTVLDLVRESVERFDRRPFLLIRPGFRTRITRYRDLGRLLPRVARVLTDRGLKRGDRVIIWAVNRPEWGIAFLGAVRRSPLTALSTWRPKWCPPEAA